MAAQSRAQPALRCPGHGGCNGDRGAEARHRRCYAVWPAASDALVFRSGRRRLQPGLGSPRHCASASAHHSNSATGGAEVRAHDDVANAEEDDESALDKEAKRAANKAYDLLSQRLYTEEGLSKKLRSKGFSEDAVYVAVTHCKVRRPHIAVVPAVTPTLLSWTDS